jgi:hypothetical protein
MTYSKKITPKCDVRDCNEPAVVTIPKYRDVSGLTTDGILHISDANFCAQHAP